MSRYAPILVLGGLICEWSDDVPSSPLVLSSGHGHVGVYVIVVPATEDGWQYYTDMGYASSNREQYCDEFGCVIEDYTNGYWTSAGAFGGGTGDTLMARLAAIADLTAWLTPPEHVVVDGPPYSDLCTDAFPEYDVRAITGSNAPFEQLGGGGWSLWGNAMREASFRQCGYTAVDEQSNPVFGARAALLPDGADIARSAIRVAKLPSPPEPLDADGPAAFIRCGEVDTRCIVDVIIGDDWYEVTAYGSEAGAVPRGARATAEDLTALVIERAGA
ncbi:hypothetical protein FVA74_10425 [Salinibacterium sp. dk2585]|uniref:hypothetical protein n=2 Tax=unclassified Salinibacterium TaxID=2632331 RepID=UPI0011C24B1F|nr:hypothetical protein [Salinibacterium sp. dk2585]QEE61936.1 hypothetical protein FVA74_10425 [Salinibacterium sp. dk2585]